MAGESVNRRSARKRATTTRYSDLPDVSKSSPVQIAKKRKIANRAPKVPRRSNQDDDTEQDSSSDEEDVGGTAELTEIADKIVPFLKQAHYPVQVLSQHPAKPEDQVVSAFAKIAGLGWTYYVTSASINIGRAPTERLSGYKLESDEKEPKIDIDLGPSKTVSRVHCSISYNSQNELWNVHVHSRNGAKVNDELLRREGEKPLKSGDVVEVAGTEMIFISPAERAKVDQIYLDRMKEDYYLKDETTRRSASEEIKPPILAKYEPPTHISPYARPDEESIPATVEASAAARPTTPMNSIMSAPYLNQSVGVSQFEHMNTMESNEHIDYASENAKDIKPPMSYATLIGQAILSTSDERLSLSGIYDWIKSNFSYYRHIEPGWQNSIRHNLSLSTSFDKKPREAHEPGKGGLWYIVDDKVEAFKKEGLKTTSRGGARQASNPNSPAPGRKSPKKEAPSISTTDQMHPINTSTPPMHARKAHLNGVQTPSKPSIAIDGVNIQQLPELSQDTPPLLRPRSYLSQNAGSPSGLSPAVFLGERNTGYSFQTPAPQRAEPRFNVPSTAKLPSQWLPQSSPNLWHIDINNKPFPFDSSPIKGHTDLQPNGLRSSSPPHSIAEGSPTRPRTSSFTTQWSGGPVLRKDVKGIEAAKHEEEDMPIDLMGGSFTAIGASATG